MKIHEDIVIIIAKILDVNPDILNKSSSVGEFKEWDSIHQLMIINSIEEKYGISFPEESLFEMNNIESIVMATKKEIKWRP